MHKLLTIIVAGGSGARMGGAVPKQFMLLAERPLLMRTLEAYDAAVLAYNRAVACDVDKIVNNFMIVLPAEFVSMWEVLCSRHCCEVAHSVTCGGGSRFESVCKGLVAACAVSTSPASSGHGYDLVAVHDGVRPFVDVDLLSNTILGALCHGSAVPAVEVTDSVRQIVCDTSATDSVALRRNELRAVQTPQVFRFSTFQHAYEQPEKVEFTDDASVVQQAGYSIHLVQGNVNNIKITTPIDLQLAEILINNLI